MPEGDKIKLKGKLPPNDRVNGLIAAAADIAAHPRQKRVYIVVMDAPESNVMHCTDEDTGDTWDEIVPVLYVRAIEEATGTDRADAEAMLARAREQRQASERNRALTLFGVRE